MNTKTKVKVKSSLKVVKPKYVITTYVDKKSKMSRIINEEIIAKKVVYSAIDAWCNFTNKEYKDFPWYKELKIKIDKYKTLTIEYNNEPSDKYRC